MSEQPHIRPLKPHRRSWRRLAWRAKLESLKRSSAPILVGPWRNEVGFEALYWIPFLENLVQRHGIAKDRIVPIGRAGSAVWYGCPQGFELYALRDPKDVRIENRRQYAQTGYLKQETVSAWDQAVFKDAATAMGLTRYETLHPAWMYHLLAPFWTGWMGIEDFSAWTAFAPVVSPALPDPVQLPEPYVAVKFYGRETFPWHDKSCRQFANVVVEKLADPANQLSVLLMDSSESADDHVNIPITVSAGNIRRMSEFVTVRPETSLAIQSAILTRAVGFVGTYGGLAQLALRCQRPSVSFYQSWGGTSILHRHLSDVLALKSGVPFQTFWTQEVGMARMVLPELVVTQPKKGTGLDTRKPVSA